MLIKKESDTSNSASAYKALLFLCLSTSFFGLKPGKPCEPPGLAIVGEESGSLGS